MKTLALIKRTTFSSQLALVLALLFPLALAGQDTLALRPAYSMCLASAGHAKLRDTYLSPITYNGWNVALGYEHFQACGFNPGNWTRMLDLSLDYSNVENRVRNNTMHALMLRSQWGIMRRWRNILASNTQLMAGPMVCFNGGVAYNPANSNNVVAARVHFAVGASVVATYNTRLASRRLTLRYTGSLPVVGAFFSPDYYESYYEIYLGNHSGLAHVGWWGNRFDMTNGVTADWQLGGTVLRIGYLNRIEDTSVNHLHTRNITHSFVLGIGGEFLTLSGKKKPNAARIISAMY